MGGRSLIDNFWVYGSPLGSPEGDGGRTEEILVSNIRCIFSDKAFTNQPDHFTNTNVDLQVGKHNKDIQYS